VLDREEQCVAELQIAQGRLEFRPSSKLDHDCALTKALGWHQRHEFMYVEESTMEKLIDTDSLERRDDREP